MKQKRHKPEEIIRLLRECDGGVSSVERLHFIPTEPSRPLDQLPINTDFIVKDGFIPDLYTEIPQFTFPNKAQPLYAACVYLGFNSIAESPSS